MAQASAVAHGGPDNQRACGDAIGDCRRPLQLRMANELCGVPASRRGRGGFVRRQPTPHGGYFGDAGRRGKRADPHGRQSGDSGSP